MLPDSSFIRSFWALCLGHTKLSAVLQMPLLLQTSKICILKASIHNSFFLYLKCFLSLSSDTLFFLTSSLVSSLVTPALYLASLHCTQKYTDTHFKLSLFYILSHLIKFPTPLTHSALWRKDYDWLTSVSSTHPL